MTETRKWTLATTLVAIAILVVGWFLLIAPKRAEVADLQTQTTAQEGANSALETELAVLKQQNKELPEKQAELAALQTKIPQTPELPTYIREMQDIGRQAGVAFTSFTPATPVQLGGAVGTPATATGALTPGQLAAVDVEMVVTGSYFEITKYMNELETSSRYTLVSGYTIADENVESTDAGSADLTATVNARIYLAPSAPAVTDPAGVVGGETVPGATTPAPSTTAPTTPTPTPTPAS